MRVLLGFRNAKLLKALFRDYLADGALKLLGRIGYGQRECLVVLRCADIAQREHGLFALKAVKLRQSQRPGHLACAVGAEVHEYDAVSLVYNALGAYDDGLYELIGDICLIAVLNGPDGVGIHCSLAADDGVVARLDSVPALVAVHTVESALYRRYFRVSEGYALVAQLCYILDGASRRNIAPVEEAVDIDLIKAAHLCHVEYGEDVIYVAVNAAVGQKAENMQRPASRLCVVHRLDVGRVFKKASVGDGVVYARQILKHDAARAYVRVAYLAVAHLPLGQADIKAGGLELSVSVFREDAVKPRLSGEAHGIAAARGRYAEAVHYYENALTHFQPPSRRLWPQSPRT